MSFESKIELVVTLQEETSESKWDEFFQKMIEQIEKNLKDEKFKM